MEIQELRGEINQLKKAFQIGRSASVKVSNSSINGNIYIDILIKTIKSSTTEFLNAVRQYAYRNPENDVMTDYFPGGDVSVNIEIEPDAVAEQCNSLILKLINHRVINGVFNKTTFINGIGLFEYKTESQFSCLTVKDEHYNIICSISNVEINDQQDLYDITTQLVGLAICNGKVAA